MATSIQQKIEDTWEVPKYITTEFRNKSSKYCICIPVINEGEKLKKQLSRMQPYAKLAGIIILDKGSTDSSTNPKFLKSQHVRTLLTLDDEGRQGTQLRMGVSYALKQNYQGIIQIDGNNKDGVEQIPEFIKALDEGYDYVQGSRFISGGKAINTPLGRWIGVRLIASPLISIAAWYLYTDVTNGFRGYSRKYLTHPKVKPFRNEFVRYEFNLYLTERANQIGLKTKEIPVTRAYPKGMVPTKISPIKGNLDFLRTIIKVSLGQYHPQS